MLYANQLKADGQWNCGKTLFACEPVEAICNVQQRASVMICSLPVLAFVLFERNSVRPDTWIDAVEL